VGLPTRGLRGDYGTGKQAAEKAFDFLQIFSRSIMKKAVPQGLKPSLAAAAMRHG